MLRRAVKAGCSEGSRRRFRYITGLSCNAPVTEPDPIQTQGNLLSNRSNNRRRTYVEPNQKRIANRIRTQPLTEMNLARNPIEPNQS
jgi:hypothetical protein